MTTLVTVFLIVAFVLEMACFLHLIVADVRAKKYKGTETFEIRDNTDDNQ